MMEQSLRQVKKFIQREFGKRGIDISAEQFSILRQAHASPGITQKDLADATFKDPASVTRMIDLLEKKDLLFRQKNKDDRRSFGIYLTREGIDLTEQLIPLVNEMLKYSIKNVSGNDHKIFTQVLSIIFENLL
jgi:DNA-binding MarR family transcriptional regulator